MLPGRAVTMRLPDNVSDHPWFRPAVAGVLGQHGFNLFWIGSVTLIGGLLILRVNLTAIWVTGMVGVLPIWGICCLSTCRAM